MDDPGSRRVGQCAPESSYSWDCGLAAACGAWDLDLCLLRGFGFTDETELLSRKMTKYRPNFARHG